MSPALTAGFLTTSATWEAPRAGAAGSAPCWEAKISYALWPRNQNTEEKQFCFFVEKIQ